MKSTLWIAILMISSPALADIASMRARIPQIVTAKDNGWVCEKVDGLLKAVDPKASGLVKAENKDRLHTYKVRAKKQKHSLTTFMKVIGVERIKKEKSGRFVENGQGKCIKKP